MRLKFEFCNLRLKIDFCNLRFSFLGFEEQNGTINPINLTDDFPAYEDEKPLREAEIVSGSHRSLLPESPEEYLKNVQTISRQGEM